MTDSNRVKEEIDFIHSDCTIGELYDFLSNDYSDETLDLIEALDGVIVAMAEDSIINHNAMMEDIEKNDL